ncbi:orotidine-5'-phosphate decarboxylase [Zavarzinella formosa]|uniref:orotidine-5'-phosphate decarboxylase n=1 Tax=Zavarzinella formosa TaxID=360055 RepID=UPI000495392D|nr:orotidine-5'-phosphate decarboxylase [Zavarzinella formosa]
MIPFAERLADAVRSKRTPLCVGLDPRWESLPRLIRTRHEDGTLNGVAAAYREFCLKILDLVAGLAPVVKPQSAFFEACGPAGLAVLQTVIAKAKQLGLVVILDSKRGDIASTAGAYAEAAFAGTPHEGRVLPVWNADALTVNPYLGRDAVEPFISTARQSAGGLFILVRTSNPGSGLFQELDCGGKKLYQVVADEVSKWNGENLSANGYGDCGAVVGATQPKELAELREKMPGVWFLVPGYGAQGGSASDVAAAFDKNGLGAIVNSSRGITFPFKPDETNWEAAVVNATQKAVHELRTAAGL